MHPNVRRTVFDGLREQVGRNGAIKTPSPQSERPVIDASVHAQMDLSAIGAAWTTARSSRTFTGGGLTPQQYVKAQPANVEDTLTDAGVAMNARATLPNRGITPLQRRR